MVPWIFATESVFDPGTTLHMFFSVMGGWALFYFILFRLWNPDEARFANVGLLLGALLAIFGVYFAPFLVVIAVIALIRFINDTRELPRTSDRETGTGYTNTYQYEAVKANFTAAVLKVAGDGAVVLLVVDDYDYAGNYAFFVLVGLNGIETWYYVTTSSIQKNIAPEIA